MKKKFFIMFLVSLVLPFAAQAATLSIVVSSSSVALEQPVRIDVSLDTQGDDANAIQGEIDFPAGQFTLKSISDGASPFSFWIDPPAETASGVVSFSGIVPGGFQGAASSVVSIWLTPTAPGVGTIALGNLQLLRNDGQGSPISVLTASGMVTVSAATSSASVATRPVSFITPESFVPVISQDPNLYGGQYFLAFSTTDKSSGIDHYEVREGSSPWQVATSPHLLQDQSLSSDILVRAVDHDGNFIIVKVPAKNPPLVRVVGSNWPLALGVLVLLLLLIMLFLRFRRRS